jgi:L-fuconolactonase
MMIIDSHAHAWQYWPYEPAVPDPQSRGRVEQLLWEMDRNGVDRAAVVCARIEHNPDNNEYIARAASAHPDRLVQFADVDCSWSQVYHRPGAAARLAAAAERYQLKGFTHYLRADYDWFSSADGLSFWAQAAECNLIASVALGPAWQAPLRELAARFPSITFLCHHMAGARAGDPARTDEIIASAVAPNIWIKLSGFHYVSACSWDYPFADAREVARRLYDAFGPERLCWGSDYPVVRFNMTYQHSLEAVRTHCDFINPADLELILGGNLDRLLQNSGR